MKDGLIWKVQLICLIRQVTLFFPYIIYIWEDSSEEIEGKTPA